MMQYYFNRAAWVTDITFLIAFALTCWRFRWSSLIAGISYAVGILTMLGLTAYSQFMRFYIGWGMSDGPSENFPLIGILLPLSLLLYATAACIFLLPAFSRRRALFFGKILHFFVLPPLVVFFMDIVYSQIHQIRAYDLSWLVYGLLWFRIREGYSDQKPA